VVEVLGPVAAVLASVKIAGEDGASVEGNPPTIRHPHVASQADHRRYLDLQPLGTPDFILRMHQLGLLPDDEDDGAPRRHHG
jgi:hypothetical protein